MTTRATHGGGHETRCRVWDMAAARAPRSMAGATRDSWGSSWRGRSCFVASRQRLKQHATRLGQQATCLVRHAEEVGDTRRGWAGSWCNDSSFVAQRRWLGQHATSLVRHVELVARWQLVCGGGAMSVAKWRWELVSGAGWRRWVYGDEQNPLAQWVRSTSAIVVAKSEDGKKV